MSGHISRAFVDERRTVRVVFRGGALDDLAAEVDRLAVERVALVCSRRLAVRAQELLGGRVVLVVDDPVMHVPEQQVQSVRSRAAAVAADCVVAVGGGSTVGLAKALALQMRIPVCAVPTTFSGSEMTQVWGVTAGGVKRTGRDPAVAPRTVIYDPLLFATLPTSTAVPSAFNAAAHAVEALYAPDRTPVTDLLATEAVRAIGAALPRLAGGESEASEEVLYGAWLAGSCLDATTMSLHHKLCHVLGGSLGLPHAEVHTVVLPHALAYNATGAPRAVAALRVSLGTDRPATALQALARATGAPTALRDLGMMEADVDRVADLVLQTPYANPRPVTHEGVRALVLDAWAGAPPLPGPAS